MVALYRIPYRVFLVPYFRDSLNLTSHQVHGRLGTKTLFVRFRD
jgi:hypothetical protein